MFDIYIDNEKYIAYENETVMDVCKRNNIFIPNFCYDKRINPLGICRICSVKILGYDNLMPACSTLLEKNMNIITYSDEIISVRRNILKLMLKNHPNDCMNCQKASECKLQEYCYIYDVNFSDIKIFETNIDNTSPYYYKDYNKCIKCGKCVYICKTLQKQNAIDFIGKGYSIKISPPLNKNINESECINCGNCINICPVGALFEKSKEKYRLWELDKKETICPFCDINCEIIVYTKSNTIVKVKQNSKSEFDLNKGLLCNIGKFELDYLKNKKRLENTYKKERVELKFALNILKNKLNEVSKDKILIITSSACSYEENGLIINLFKNKYNINNIISLNELSGEDMFCNEIDELKYLKESDLYVFLGNIYQKTNKLNGFIKSNISKTDKIIAFEEVFSDLFYKSDIYIEGDRNYLKERLKFLLDILKINKIDKKNYSNELIEIKELLDKSKQKVLIYDSNYEEFIKFLMKNKEIKELLNVLNMKIININNSSNIKSLKFLEQLYKKDLYNYNQNILKKIKSKEFEFVYIINDYLKIDSYLISLLENIEFKVYQGVFEDELYKISDLTIESKSFFEKTGHYIDKSGRTKKIRPILNSKNIEIKSIIGLLEN